MPELSEGMRAFARKYDLSPGDPKLHGLYELDLSARMDERAMIQSAKQEGLAQGRESTLREAVLGMARRGLSVELICDCLNTTREEVNGILARSVPPS